MSDRHRLNLGPIATPDRLLLGPGPSNAHPTVLQALSRTPIGHLDPLYVALMGEVQELLRYVWQTDNRLTLPMVPGRPPWRPPSPTWWSLVTPFLLR